MDMWAAASEYASSESDSGGNGFEEYWYESTDFWLELSTDTGLVFNGWGDMGYRFRNLSTGADFQGATGTLSEFTLGAGVWTIQFADMGYGESSTTEDYWESEDGSEWYYSYYSSSSANGGMTIDVGVPAPGAIALLGLAGLGVRRRRRG
jgi:MYXO-CTERM domain-containing protein